MGRLKCNHCVADSQALFMRETHGLCDEHGDVASASLLENWIDEAERRTWFLFEASRPGEPAGHADGA